jgi:hypothetical protein
MKSIDILSRRVEYVYLGITRVGLDERVGRHLFGPASCPIAEYSELGKWGAASCGTMNRVMYSACPQSPETEAPIPSYIADLDDTLATWYQATNDGSGWKLEKKERPLVGDYLHSEFRKSVTVSPEEIEGRICAILTERDPNAKTAVCRIDRTGRTLDGWRHRTLNNPVKTAVPSHAKLNLPGQ